MYHVVSGFILCVCMCVYGSVTFPFWASLMLIFKRDLYAGANLRDKNTNTNRQCPYKQRRQHQQAPFAVIILTWCCAPVSKGYLT